MTTTIEPQRGGGDRLVTAAEPDLVADWLRSKSEKTREAYAGDLHRFATWLETTPSAAAERLLASGPGGARSLALRYRAHLQERGLAPATINRSMSALRSLVSLARDAMIVDWDLRIKNLRARAYRDTSGPSKENVVAILAAAEAQSDRTKAARDTALLRLLYCLALRRAEATSLDVNHFEQDGAKILVRGKGYVDRVPLRCPQLVLESLKTWIEVHPDPRPDAPLFVSLHRGGRGLHRLSGRSVARILATASERAGVRVYSPHALRHAAITAALTATGGDHRKVRAYSRHASIETVLRYDDHRLDGAYAVARLVVV